MVYRSRSALLILALALTAATGRAQEPAFPAFCTDRLTELVEGGGPAAGIDSLIATLPDPIESNFAREFDLFLAAIRRAMETRGYTQDRHCLPWSDPSLREKDPDQPGMMLFRRDRRDVRVVLVVGETPSWGVSRRALSRSLRFAREVLEARKIKILGPTFSGSTTSLARGLDAWLREMLPAQAAQAPQAASPATTPQLCGEDDWQIDVVSGTATGTDNALKFARNLQERARYVCYESTAASNDRLQEVLWDEFAWERLGLDTRKAEEGREERGRRSVVVLQESSVYGEDFAKRGFRVFPFPMNISSLVEEYRKDPSRLGEVATAGGGLESALKLPERTLPLRLGSRRMTRDRVPFFSPSGTTNSIDLVLNRLVAEIAQARTQIVAIVASSTFDTIFLAQYVRARAPNVRLATFEGDLLLAHPDLGRSTRGMIVVSSNSMVIPDPGATDGGSGAKVHLQFPSDTAHGVFKAVQRLATDPGGTAPGIREVWVSVVGKGALETIKRYPMPPALMGSAIPRPPRGWSVLFATSTALVFLVLYVLARKTSGRARLRLGLGKLAWIPPEDARANPAATKRLACVTILLIALCIGYPLIGLPYLRYTGDRPDYRLASLTAYVLLALLATAAVYLLVVLVSRTLIDLRGLRRGGPDAAAADAPPEGRARTARRSALRLLDRLWPVLVTAALMVAACGTTWMIFQTGPLFLQRCVSFAAGVNPLAPALLMTAVPISWLLLALRRFRTLDGIPRGLRPHAADPTRELEQPATSLRLIRNCIGPGSYTPGPWVAGLLVPLLYLAFYYGDDPSRLVRGVDKPGFDRMMSALLVGGAALSVASGLAAGRLWRELRRLSGWIAIRLRPEGGRDWLELLKPSRATAEEVRTRRDRSYEELRGAAGSGSRPGAGGRLAGPLPPELATLPEAGKASRASFAEAWSLALPWLAAIQLAGAGAGSASADEKGPAAAEPHPHVAVASQFLTWQTAMLAKTTLLHALWRMGFMTAGLLLLLVSVSAYPFEPQSVLGLWLGVLITLGAVASIITLVQIENEKTVGEFTVAAKGFSHGRSMITRFGLLGGLPLISLLASQFPSIGNVLLDWLRPLLQVMK